MNFKLRKFLWRIDYRIYLIKRWFTRKYVIFKLLFEKDKEKRDKLLALYIFHSFSSRWEIPIQNIIKKLSEVDTNDC